MSLILCRHEPVRHPYYIERLGIHIASSQELCYVIYNNPLLAMEGLINDNLIDRSLKRERESRCRPHSATPS